MGKHKTEQGTGHHAAARRYAVDEQATEPQEQHNPDKLVAQGTIVEGGGSRKA